MLVFAHLFPDISIKLTKLHFQSWEIIFSNDFALFLKNDCRGIKAAFIMYDLVGRRTFFFWGGSKFSGKN